MEVSRTEVLDTHAHIVPRSLLTALQQRPVAGFSARRTERGWVVAVPGTGETRPIGARMTDAGPRADWQRHAGVTRQILSPWLDIQAGGRDWARTLNDAMADAAAEAGTVALASVTGDQATEDLLEAWKRPEFAGLLLNTDPPDGPAPHEPAFDPLWTLAAAEGIPVVLHPPTCGPSDALASLGTMGNVHGRLIDNTVAITRLILAGVLDRHPGLKLVLVHGGGFLPYQAHRLDGGYRTKEAFAGELAREKPSAYLGDFHYDTVGLSAPAIAFLAGFGPVLLGSDYPFALGDPDPVRTVRESGLDDAFVEAILHTNADALFRRPA
ncbi:aminocarboxymuconate-semialdehyde decarboxylase [Amycolatopsis pretoriensis]|uniref:Aminocarboxymuconate-semialdehyde decarboxylase n=1 Tax=Amycolatopsis pretoriensis TaxID=218821 RepID=A0A1H5QI21_9PSEU|nr:aminocarboxymuconate-semialdehyde decarboxylase [Amycolatopsis pretoriensis]